MKKTKVSKWKLVGALSTSIFLGMPSLDAEALAFRFTAPSDALVTFSCAYLARKFSPSVEEKGFIHLATPQTQKRP